MLCNNSVLFYLSHNNLLSIGYISLFQYANGFHCQILYLNTPYIFQFSYFINSPNFTSSYISNCILKKINKRVYLLYSQILCFIVFLLFFLFILSYSYSSFQLMPFKTFIKINIHSLPVPIAKFTTRTFFA